MKEQRDYLIKMPDLGFILHLKDGERLEDVNVPEYFLKAMDIWVQETGADEIDGQLTVEYDQ